MDSGEARERFERERRLTLLIRAETFRKAAETYPVGSPERDNYEFRSRESRYLGLTR